MGVFSADCAAFNFGGGFGLDCVCSFMKGVRRIPTANFSWWMGFVHPRVTVKV